MGVVVFGGKNGAVGVVVVAAAVVVVAAVVVGATVGAAPVVVAAVVVVTTGVVVAVVAVVGVVVVAAVVVVVEVVAVVVVGRQSPGPWLVCVQPGLAHGWARVQGVPAVVVAVVVGWLVGVLNAAPVAASETRNPSAARLPSATMRRAQRSLGLGLLAVTGVPPRPR